jgi:hypothetical protein
VIVSDVLLRKQLSSIWLEMVDYTPYTFAQSNLTIKFHWPNYFLVHFFVHSFTLQDVMLVKLNDYSQAKVITFLGKYQQKMQEILAPACSEPECLILLFMLL